MSCACSTKVVVSPSGEQLPLVADDCAVAAKSTSLCTSCVTDSACLSSDRSDGTSLASTWADAVCCSEGLVILARKGTKLSRFAGSGFIQLENGLASVVPSVPLRTSTLWHRWWRPTPSSTPILGEPLTYPYQVIADSEGNLHSIKGTDAEDSVSLWNSTTKAFAQTPFSEAPHSRKGALPLASNIELVGYAPIVAGGLTTTVRQEKALSGKGLVILTERPTINNSCDCGPGTGTASVASTLALPVPVSTEAYVLTYSTALGLHWTIKA